MSRLRVDSGVHVVSIAPFPGTFAEKVNAAAAAAGPGGTIWVPENGGPYTLAAPVTLTDVGICSDGAVINTPPLGAGAAALTFTGSGTPPRNVRLEGFNLVGPGVYSLGARNANCDGIKVTGPVYTAMRNVRVERFDSGVVWNNDLGHLTHDNITITNCYYGIYCTFNTFDYAVSNSNISGNLFACFATPADQGFGSMVLTTVHTGFSPYGIYQEPLPAAQGISKLFLQEVIMRNVRFESVGNAAILSDATEDASNHSFTANLLMEHCGFVWNDAYKIAARDKDYAVVFPITQRNIKILAGPNNFTAGTLNVFRIKNNVHDAFEVVGGTLTTSSFKVDGGNGVNGIACYKRAMSADPSAPAVNLGLGTSSGWLMPDNSPGRRYGGDASGLFIDGNANGVTVRNSAAGYGTVAKILPSGGVFPRVYLDPAGGTGGPFWAQGSGSPEGVLAAPAGSLYSNTAGGVATTLYVKSVGTGNTGWTAVT